MKQTHEVISELRGTRSRLKKEQILKENCENLTLRECFRLAYDQTLNFNIKSVGRVTSPDQPSSTLDEVVFKILPDIVSQKIKGRNAIKDLLVSELSKLSSEDADIVLAILKRDLKVGATTKTVNKIWPGLIPEFEFQLADTDKSHITYPAYCQEKIDGGRAHGILKSGRFEFITRGGNFLKTHGVFDIPALHLFEEGDVVDGEIMFLDESDNILPRKASNGLMNKAVRGTILPSEIERAVFVVWDIVNLPGPYESRFAELEKRMLLYKTQKIQLVESHEVQSYEEAMELYRKFVCDGKEGVILKNKSAHWVGERTKDLCKIKETKDADLLIVGWVEGTGRNQGRLGALELETKEGILKVKVGTGFSDKERDEIRPENCIGRVAAIEYNMKIQDEGGNHSLFLPRFIEIRTDKSEPNSFEDLM